MSAKKTRTRVLTVTRPAGRLDTKTVDIGPPRVEHVYHSSRPSERRFGGRQITTSEGHPFSHRQGANKGDVGGDFFTELRSMIGGETAIAYSTRESYPGGYTDYQYNGSASPLNAYPESLWPSNGVVDLNRLNALGTTAISIVKPTNSVGQLSTALGEIYHDGLPDLPGAHTWKSKTRSAKNAGGEYLNIQFGWLPLVSDIKRVAHGVSNADRIIAQYVRDAGKPVRRRYNFPVQTTTTTEVAAYNRGLFLTPDAGALYDGANRGELMLTKEKVSRQWFSGAFTYHLPRSIFGDRMSKPAVYAKKILGLELTPEVLWNLTPWSWAIDWFSNAGDVVSNVSSFATDGLVMQYGYVMETTINKHTYWLTKNGLYDRSITAPPVSFVTTTKTRTRANPFGFGITFDGLSPRQTAITIALGLSRW